MGSSKLKWIVSAVALLAAALGILFVSGKLTNDSPMPTERESEAVDRGGADLKTGTPVSADIVLAEIDGAVKQVHLPGGEVESAVFPEGIPADLQRAAYQGLDPALQQSGAPFLWYERQIGARIFGRTVASDGRETAPVYACDTEKMECAKTEGAQSGASAGEVAQAPQGAVSASGARIALIIHHDVPYINTGTRWDLLVYETEHLAAPVKTIDISVAIDRSPEAGYDSVSSVAWSPDEKRLAIGTTQKIIIADITSGVVTPVYEAPAPADEEDFPFWDGNSLLWSPSGRYLVFAGYSGKAGANAESDEETTDILRTIDLEAKNELKTLVTGTDVRLVVDE